MPVLLLKDSTSLTPYEDTEQSNAITEELWDSWGAWKSVRDLWFARIGFCDKSNDSLTLEFQWGNNAQNKTYYKGKYLADTSEIAMYLTMNVMYLGFEYL